MLENIIRPFWTEGLNEITGKLPFNLIEVIDQKNGFVIYEDIKVQEFNLTLLDYKSFLKGFAKDINRFGCASLESINEINYKANFKKSHAWKCIIAYYSAYYSAHAFLRMLGISCTNFEQSNLRGIENIAELYSNRNGISIEKGYYKCVLNHTTHTLTCSKISKSGSKGSHEQLWEIFLQTINYLIGEIKLKSTNPEVQITISKLSDLKNTMTYLGSNGGNWLSKVRNEINYKHVNGLWYQYNSSEKYYDKIEVILNYWKEKPELIDLTEHYDKPILKYLSSCLFIISLTNSLSKEMSQRCPTGVSFQNHGIISLLNRM